MLSFSRKDGNDTDHFELRLVDNRAELRFIPSDADRAELAAIEVPVPKPIRLTRIGAIDGGRLFRLLLTAADDRSNIGRSPQHERWRQLNRRIADAGTSLSPHTHRAADGQGRSNPGGVQRASPRCAHQPQTARGARGDRPRHDLLGGLGRVHPIVNVIFDIYKTLNEIYEKLAAIWEPISDAIDKVVNTLSGGLAAELSETINLLSGIIQNALITLIPNSWTSTPSSTPTSEARLDFEGGRLELARLHPSPMDR